MQTLRRISYYGFLALLIYMPFHILLSQWLSLATGGLEVWKIAKDVVLLVLTLFTICLVLINREGSRLFYWLLGGAVLYGVLHLILWATNNNLFTDSAILGVVYNNRLPCFLLLGYGATLLNRDKFVFSSVLKVMVVVSTLVALLGVVQFFLPKDLLTHFGYSLDRGARAAFFIDDNPALPRIMATLREPNALGAYLILPISLLTALIVRVSGKGRRLLLAGVLLLHCLALFLTFSRSAWLGALLAAGVVLWWSYKKQLKHIVRTRWPILAVVAILLVGGGFVVRDQPLFREYITHATEEEVKDLDSNDYHVLLIREGVEGVIDHPLGHGPGTAGLASIRDPDGGQLTENYYVQIAYEVGIVGLIVFLAISALVYYRLWLRHDFIGIFLIAGFWGYVVMNMLLHTWSNEAVAAQWWLLAGAALTSTLPARSTSTTKRGAS